MFCNSLCRGVIPGVGKLENSLIRCLHFPRDHPHSRLHSRLPLEVPSQSSNPVRVDLRGEKEGKWDPGRGIPTRFHCRTLGCARKSLFSPHIPVRSQWDRHHSLNAHNSEIFPILVLFTPNSTLIFPNVAEGLLYSQVLAHFPAFLLPNSYPCLSFPHKPTAAAPGIPIQPHRERRSRNPVSLLIK